MTNLSYDEVPDNLCKYDYSFGLIQDGYNFFPWQNFGFGIMGTAEFNKMSYVKEKTVFFEIPWSCQVKFIYQTDYKKIAQYYASISCGIGDYPFIEGTGLELTFNVVVCGLKFHFADKWNAFIEIALPTSSLVSAGIMYKL